VQEEYTENPEIITFVDGEQSKLHVEISLVNVEKENISLMMDENGFYLHAPAEDVTYVATLSFLRTIKPSEAKAVFDDGYLRIEAPFSDPLKNYVKVPIEEKN
jgi:HSP20 family molecular chaperone IbpA